jgi:pimeloyl-ACP methyl ester carboxylesterase
MLHRDKPLQAPPLIAFRRELDPKCGLLKNEKTFPASPARLDAALLKAWESYRLWEDNRLVPCAGLPSGAMPTTVLTEIGSSASMPVSNIVPPTFCVKSSAIPPIVPVSFQTSQPDIPIVIVPGIMGTRLVDPRTGDRVWDPRLPLNVARMNTKVLSRVSDRLDPDPKHHISPSDPNFKLANSIPNFGNLVAASYSDLAFTLRRSGHRVIAAGYDWRQDNAESAKRLGGVIDQIGAPKVILIAHSMGGLVSRYFCRTGGESKVCGLILLGSPTLGAPRAYRMLKTGEYWDPSFPIDVFLARGLLQITSPILSVGSVILRKAVREFVRKFPSVYQLLPNQGYCSRFSDWLRFNAKFTVPPGPITPKPKDASDAHELYWNGYTGFLEPPSAAIARILTLRDRFDNTLGSYMHPNSYVLYGENLPTEACSLLRGLRKGPFSVSIGKHLPNSGDMTVPATSAAAGSRARLMGLRGINHSDVARHPTAIKEIQSFVADIVAKCGVPAVVST